jgi:hypothetical protein
MSFASWFNVSPQETWESRVSFPSGDHKAVKRLERPRSGSRIAPWKMDNYLYITVF